MEVLAGRIPNLDSDTTEALIRGNLLKSLSMDIINKLNLQFGHLNGVSNETLIIVASILECQLGNSELPKVVPCTNASLSVAFSKPVPKKCYRCGMRGHIKRHCRVNIHKRAIVKPHELSNCFFNREPKNKYPDRKPDKMPVNPTRSETAENISKRKFVSSKNSNGGKKVFRPRVSERDNLYKSNPFKTSADPIMRLGAGCNFDRNREAGSFSHGEPKCHDDVADRTPSPSPTNISAESHRNDKCEQIIMDWDVESINENLNNSFSSSFNLDGIFVSESLDVHDERESGYSSSDSRISGSSPRSERKTESEVLTFSDGFDCSLLSFGNISFYEFPLNQTL